MRMKQNILILVMIFSVFVLNSCRKQYKATEQHMADYGWLLYEKATGRSDYENSKEWFLSSVNEDTTYMDGYNGLGWSYGKLTEIDSSLYYFQKGLRFQPSIYDTANVRYQLWAGLCFANNAKGQNASSVLFGDSLISDLTTGLTSNPWTFSHNNINSNSKIDHLDVRVTLAASNYALGDFNTSIDHMQKILSELSNTTSSFNPDVNTVAGRTTLAVYIDSIQTILSSQ